MEPRSRRRRSASRPAGPPRPAAEASTQGAADPEPTAEPAAARSTPPAVPRNPPDDQPTDQGPPSRGRRRQRTHRTVPEAPADRRPPTDTESAGFTERRRPADSESERSGDRSLRGLISTRSSQVSSDAALRARDFAMPTQQDLAEAERDLVIVRRHYVPPAPLTAGKRPPEFGRREAGDERRRGRRSG